MSAKVDALVGNIVERKEMDTAMIVFLCKSIPPWTPRPQETLLWSSCAWHPYIYLVCKCEYVHCAKGRKKMAVVVEGPEPSCQKMLWDYVIRQQEVWCKQGKHHFLGSAEKFRSSGGWSRCWETTFMVYRTLQIHYNASWICEGQI